MRFLELMRRSKSITVILAIVAVTAACGEDDDTETQNDGNNENTVTETAAAIDGLDELEIELTTELEQIASHEITFGNIGDADLTYSFDVDADWLTVDPVTGTLAEDDTAVIDLEATCGAEAETRTTEVEIVTNDPDRELVTLSIHLDCVEAGQLPGKLSVAIEGLPDSLDGSISVNGPDDFSTIIVGSETLSDLPAGEYLLSPLKMTQNNIDYTAEDVEVTILSGETEYINIAYNAVPGSIDVSISGLPDEANGQVELTGPEDFQETITTDTTFAGVRVGTYDVSISEVIVGGSTYTALGDLDFTLDVVSEQTEIVAVEYVAVPGSVEITIDGLPGDVSAKVFINGPGLSKQQILESTTIPNLLPGSYEVTAEPTDPSDVIYGPDIESETIDVESDTESTITITYEALPGTVNVTIVGLPDGLAADIVFDDGDGSTYTATANESLDITPGDYDVTVYSVIDTSGNEYQPATASSSITAVSGESTDFEAIYLDPLQVSNGANDGTGSLRALVDTVSSGASISIGDNVGTIALTEPIVIDKDITIEGPGAENLEISADSGHRHFTISSGEVAISNLTLSNGDFGFGGSILNDGELHIENVTFIDNFGEESGGAIHSNGDLTVLNSTFIDNTSESNGGAIYQDDGELFIANSTFHNNRAFNAGALRLVGESVRIESSTFSDNLAGFSGPAGDGGAISSTVDLNVINSTFSTNSAHTGGGLYQEAGHLVLIGSTIANNSAESEGGGLYVFTNAGADVGGSIIAENMGDTNPDVADSFENIESLGYNLIGNFDGSDAFIDGVVGDIVGIEGNAVDPQLASLADNGGATATMALNPASIAYAHIPLSECLDELGDLLADDQRGALRGVTETCDIGAHETGGFETFDEFEYSGSAYDDGDFLGNRDIIWEYLEARSDFGFEIDGTGMMLRDNTSSIISEPISGGISNFSVKYRKAHTGGAERKLALYVNNETIEESPIFGDSSGEDNEVFELSATGINISGDVTIELRNDSPNSGNSHIVIDDISWDAYMD